MTPDLIASSAPLNPPALEREALEAWLLAGIAASTGPEGKLDPDWMVMHIRLIHCGMIRIAHLAANGSAKRDHNRYSATISSGEALLRSVLSAMLPLFVEFADPLECSVWLQEDGPRASVRNPAFIKEARAAGLPVVESDLAYALIPQDDREKEAFRELARCARLAMMQ